MTVEQLAAAYEAITATGATVGKLVCGEGVVQEHGIFATAYDLGFATVEVEIVPGTVFGLQKVITTLEEI